MHCIKTEVKYMKAGTSIVNAASSAGLRGVSRCAAYCASKHGVIGLTRVAAKDFGSRGIRVSAIAPGYVITPLTAKMGASLGPKVKETLGRGPILRRWRL